MSKDNHIILFQEQKIRRIWHGENWFYAVTDVVEVLTGSSKPRDYWYRLKEREEKSTHFQLSTICRQLKMEAPDGKLRDTECADTEAMFRHPPGSHKNRRARPRAKQDGGLRGRSGGWRRAHGLRKTDGRSGRFGAKF